MPDLKLKIHMHVSSTDIKSACTFQEFERKKKWTKMCLGTISVTINKFKEN